MEIAAYPVPYIVPTPPQTTEVRPVRGMDSGLPSRRSFNSPEERVLHGEVLNKRRRNGSQDADTSRYIFEQQARRSRPDLSGLDSDSRYAIESYLDNDDPVNRYGLSQSLIDEYV